MAQKSVFQLLFPDDIKCFCCNNELSSESEYGLCGDCDLPVNTQFCLKCGRALNNMAHYCTDCMNNSKAFDKARSAFELSDNIRKVLYRFKYGGCGYLAKFLALYLRDVYLSSDFNADVITFVPIHKSRKRRRGYNQSQLLSKELSLLTGIPVEELLIKTRKTKPVSKLKAADRLKEIEGSIELSGNADASCGKTVLLIDDVFTTGTTANVCSLLLKSKGGADKVFVLTAASVKQEPDLY